MGEHPNAGLYRTYLERFVAGDIEAVAPLLADGVVWHEPGGGGAIRAKEPLLDQMRRVTTTLRVEIDLHDVVASDDHTVALVEWRVTAGDRSLTSRQVEIWHVREGAVAERWLFVEDLQAFMDFFTALAG